MAGSKTYIVAALTAAYGLIGFALGFHDVTAMIGFISAALTAAGLRHGITTEVSK